MEFREAVHKIVENHDKDLEALLSLVLAVESTGGIRYEKFGDKCFAVPIAEYGFDLVVANAYLLACKVLNREPKKNHMFESGPSPYLCYIERFRKE